MARGFGAKPRKSCVLEMASRFGVNVSNEIDMRVYTWLDLLVTWNAKMDLTAARSEAELCDLMLADAFALSSRVAPDARVVDIGSGAGAPGLPLALLRPDLKVTLVEPLSKRVSFLRTVIGSVGRVDIDVRRARVEEIAPGDVWDVAISRATLAPEAWLSAGRGLVGAGGTIWVLLAREEAPSAEGTELLETIEYEWPNQNQIRRAARYQRA
jgi:16S rRNA (guanine527-N7)-methyltransferase